jgi:outer membrane protein assembly factor BamB
MKNKWLAPLLTTLCLTACDKEKTPLPGDRQSVIILDQSIKVDVSLQNQSVSVPTPGPNADWPQVGGNPPHTRVAEAMEKAPKLLWKRSVGYGSHDGLRLISGPVMAKGKVFSIDAYGTVFAVHAETGETIWERSIRPEHADQEALGGGVAYDEGVVYVSSPFGHLWALKEEDGSVIWESTTISPARVAPTVQDGRVFVVTISNETLAFDAKTGAKIWSHSGIVEQAALLGGASPAVSDGMVLVTYSSGEIYALQAQNGHVLWNDTLTSAVRIDTVSTIPHIRARPIVDKNQVFAISHGGRMTAIDLHSGARLWQKEVGGVRSPALGGDWLFVQTSYNDVLCMNRHTGGIRWASALPKFVSSEDKTPVHWAGPILVGDQLVFAGSHARVVFLNVADGKISQEISFEGEAYISPIVANKTLYILSDAAYLYAFR